VDVKISDLKIGAQLILGKYGVRNNIPFPVMWLKCTPNSDFITQSAVDYLPFDANEPDNDEFRGYGNPNYGLSNLLAFMNSADESWYRPTHSTDTPPDMMHTTRSSQYQSHYGFLYHFEEYEIESLVKTTVEVSGERVTSAIRLPSSEELSGAQRFELFQRKGIRAKGTEDMIANRLGHNFDYNSFIPVWVRNKSVHFVKSALCLSRNCSLDTVSPRNSSGLRPVCTINPDTPVILGEDGYYYIKPRPVQRNVYTDEELFELLGLAQP